MALRTANAVWNRTLQDGDGQMRFGGGAFEGAYSFESRFEEGEGTNPEELIAAAHAGCFSMALSGELGKAGYSPEKVSTEARVSLVKEDEGFRINRIQLVTEATVPEISEDEFLEIAEAAKKGCPVSQALAGPEITLDATLNAGAGAA
ncbi:MAG: OsmC family protein [Longimicrobiales bacterium]|nr:OsmC family protein [Longimicrobiales bacterium]